MTDITVVGGGFAGVEAAWQLAKRGVSVTLCEMKPERFSPAHSNTAGRVVKSSDGMPRVCTCASRVNLSLSVCHSGASIRVPVMVGTRRVSPSLVLTSLNVFFVPTYP